MTSNHENEEKVRDKKALFKQGEALDSHPTRDPMTPCKRADPSFAKSGRWFLMQKEKRKARLGDVG